MRAVHSQSVRIVFENKSIVVQYRKTIGMTVLEKIIQARLLTVDTFERDASKLGRPRNQFVSRGYRATDLCGRQ